MWQAASSTVALPQHAPCRTRSPVAGAHGKVGGESAGLRGEVGRRRPAGQRRVKVSASSRKGADVAVLDGTALLLCRPRTETSAALGGVCVQGAPAQRFKCVLRGWLRGRRAGMAGVARSTIRHARLVWVELGGRPTGGAEAGVARSGPLGVRGLSKSLRGRRRSQAAGVGFGARSQHEEDQSIDVHHGVSRGMKSSVQQQCRSASYVGGDHGSSAGRSLGWNPYARR